MNKCYFCGAESSYAIYRSSVCSSCGKELKICKNCLHFDPQAANQCREPQAERVPEKERANFCDYFSPSGKAPGENDNSKATEARNKLKDLFS